MAIIHRTTLTPGKLELVAGWLQRQPWYRGTGQPELSKAGGFRLDDPAGDVGLEFMVVNDQAGDDLVSYHVPMTYRAAPLAGADSSLIGTSEHGVLGRRWVYDGVHDPVLVEQLFNLLQGRAHPQAQGESNTPDPTVQVDPLDGETLSLAGFAVTGGDAVTSKLAVRATGAADSTVPVVIRLVRLLAQNEPVGLDPLRHSASVRYGWTLPDGSAHRCLFAYIA